MFPEIGKVGFRCMKRITCKKKKKKKVLEQSFYEDETQCPDNKNPSKNPFKSVRKHSCTEVAL